MGCGSCSTTKNGVPQGCGDKGHCTSGSCNKMNTFDWLNHLDIPDPYAFKYVEVSFKKGARKNFFINDNPAAYTTGDMVVVDDDGGYDVGRISLSGELVRAQMRKKSVGQSGIDKKIVRRANHRDLEKLEEARGLEKNTLIRGRAIARTLDLELKLGEVEYRGDKRKATFYYTANGRIDFRELVRNYAKEFRVKVEMRQIGSRQESALIGGIGSCGRELCCSTWLSDFQSVSTTAARYQNIAINQSKLSGQCGRLKCCLNYELDTYLDAIEDFPKKADYIHTEKGKAQLIKIDIFKRVMYFAYVVKKGRSPFVAVGVDRVKEIIKLNKEGEKPEDLFPVKEYEEMASEDITFAADEMTDVVQLPDVKRRKGRNKKRNTRKPNAKKGPRSPEGKTDTASNKPKPKSRGNRNNRNKNQRKPNPNKSQDSKPQGGGKEGSSNQSRSKGPDSKAQDGKPKSQQTKKPRSNKPPSNKTQANKTQPNKLSNTKSSNTKPSNNNTKSDKPNPNKSDQSNNKN